MVNPTISVVITSYNQKQLLVEAIESVIAQTLRPHEILIADDHSTDGSADLIEVYVARHPGWIKALIQPRNVGVAKNRNEALSRVQGDLVTFLDGDDRFLPRKLEQEYATYRATPNAPIVHSNIYHIDRTGRRLRLWADREAPPEGYVFPQVLARRYPGGTTFRNELVETRCLREVGGYDETLPRYGDWDLIIRLTQRFQTAYCPEPLTEYRRHGDSLSHAPGPVHLAAVMRIYEKYRPTLADMTEHDREDVERSFRDTFARLARRSAREAMDSNDRRVAFEFWARALEYDRGGSPALLGRVMLPARVYRVLRSIYRVWAHSSPPEKRPDSPYLQPDSD
jgi:glycosyltransferase involved in cell wall biosynthesis